LLIIKRYYKFSDTFCNEFDLNLMDLMVSCTCFSNLIHSLFLKVDPLGAQQKVLEIATTLGLDVSVAVAHEVSVTNLGT
jgi:hypothetical protein